MRAGLIDDFVRNIFYPYHSVRAILSIPFCPYHFVRYHFVLEPLAILTRVGLILYAHIVPKMQSNLSLVLLRRRIIDQRLYSSMNKPPGNFNTLHLLLPSYSRQPNVGLFMRVIIRGSEVHPFL